ncbi:hypothetical protein, partial [Salmonella sp. SAL4455]|uniref:hypothetical protein n=1 Tax=Salmonella sp. SAL4455 TaxID=3159910 RepID=UPI00397AC688
MSIAEASSASIPSVFAVLGTILDITAPAASTASPLTIRITVHLSASPAGFTQEDLAVSRDGVAIADCTCTPGHADPD